MKELLNREVRKYIYLVAVAAVPVLIFYGVIEPAAGALVLPLVLALLNLSPDDTEGADE